MPILENADLTIESLRIRLQVNPASLMHDVMESLQHHPKGVLKRFMHHWSNHCKNDWDRIALIQAYCGEFAHKNDMKREEQMIEIVESISDEIDLINQVFNENDPDWREKKAADDEWSSINASIDPESCEVHKRVDEALTNNVIPLAVPVAKLIHGRLVPASIPLAVPVPRSSKSDHPPPPEKTLEWEIDLSNVEKP